jgi:hypothetical protein
MRLATALGALALGAGPLTVHTLARPAFPGPVAYPLGHLLVLVSSRYQAPTAALTPDVGATPFQGKLPVAEFISGGRDFLVYGRDASSGRFLVAYSARRAYYVFDFKNYAWPPRIRPGDREFVYEQPVWAHEAAGVLYVENAHSTYASSSYSRNGYITAIDLKTRRTMWRSSALVANATTFLVTPHYLITGYGFTDEPDFLLLLDRRTGRVVSVLSLPTAPEKITWHGKLVHVRTYDHVLLVRLVGA